MMGKAANRPEASLVERLVCRVVAMLASERRTRDAETAFPAEARHCGILHLPNNANFQDWAGADDGTTTITSVTSDGGSNETGR